ncbi:serine hydrolase [Phytohabitans kaempferiae]|uniref:Serine hydrolase n=1 Tax=Phytohabitans kaempferiae TaxID=1620943 RepID=A0ABV6LWL5_9ACTN
MAGKRQTGRWVFWLLGGTALLGLVLAGLGLRTLPGSPIAAEAASRKQTVSPSASAAADKPKPSPTPSPSPTLKPLAVQPAEVNIDASGWWSWALLDRRTGKVYGSSNMTQTNTTASLIKSWIAADYLRRAAEKGQTPTDARMQQVTIMIRDSDNQAAQSLWEAIGGSASIGRLIKTCKLTDSSAYKNMWSNTRLSARDTARLGACIADGRAAGKTWTKWLINEMRAVRGVGDFGIRKAFPVATAKDIAIKNGWVTRDALGEWHVNCLAIGDGWTMGVMTRYPASLGYTHGAEICQSVAEQLKR